MQDRPYAAPTQDGTGKTKKKPYEHTAHKASTLVSGTILSNCNIKVCGAVCQLKMNCYRIFSVFIKFIQFAPNLKDYKYEARLPDLDEYFR